jgi:PAS domain S-box-containing protein
MERNRVLLVEDEVEEAGHLKRCLDDIGCHVVATASTGREAVEEARLHQPNLVLMDIVLEGDMDGIETSHRIRDHMDVPIIYITAYSDREYLNQVWDTDPFGFISKPCDMDTLKASIQVAMHRKLKEELVIEAREKYRGLFDTMSDPIAVFSASDDKILHVNQRLCSLLDRPENELIGRSIWEIFPNETVKKYKSIIEHIAQDITHPYEPMLLSRADGDVVPVEASLCSSVLDSVEMITLTFRDISKKKLAEWERKLIDELRLTMNKKKDAMELYTICAHCKKVKDSIQTWRNLESFFYHHLNIEFSHGICPDCLSGFYTPPKKTNSD